MTLNSYKTVFFAALIILALFVILPKLLGLLVPVAIGFVIGYVVAKRSADTDGDL